MRFCSRSNVAAMTIALAGLSMLGCHKSSHTSVSSYEYSEQSRTERAPQGNGAQDQPDSEYHMVAPGQMASPGEMAAPGRMVVEPRRNP